MGVGRPRHGPRRGLRVEGPTRLLLVGGSGTIGTRLGRGLAQRVLVIGVGARPGQPVLIGSGAVTLLDGIAEPADAGDVLPTLDLVGERLGAYVLLVALARVNHHRLPWALAILLGAGGLVAAFLGFGRPQLDLGQQLRQAIVNGFLVGSATGASTAAIRATSSDASFRRRRSAEVRRAVSPRTPRRCQEFQLERSRTAATRP